MGNERAVEGDEPQVLDLTLREQHPVERITGRRLGRERMALVDRNDPDAETVEELRLYVLILQQRDDGRRQTG